MANANIFQSYLQPPKSVLEYAADLDRADMSRLALEGRRGENALLLLTRQQKADEAQQQIDDRNALQRITSSLPADATPQQRASAYRGSGRPGLVTQADAIEKAALDRSKIEADVGKTSVETDAAKFKNQQDKQKASIQMMASYTSPADAAAEIDAAEKRGEVPPQIAAALRSTIPQDASQFNEWKLRMIIGLTDPAKMAELLKPVLQTRNTGGSTDTLAVDPVTGRATVTNSVKNTASPDAILSADTARRGQNMTDARGKEAIAVARDKLTKGGGSGRAMSATLQKELIESDDLKATAEQTAATLKKALELNRQAYTGYGAKLRAQVRSNLPGQSQAADATINLDNMIGEQALSGMKAIFGGNPTEGERAILLDLQASADKTPAQREAIISRGIAAAERRAKISAERAKSIRTGTYLSEGAEPDDGPDIDSLLSKYQ